MTDHAPGDELLEPVDTASCLRLLQATEVGRLAVVVDGRPRIVVLNHLLDGGDVLFRTRADSMLAGLTQGRAVHAAYEVDSAFPVLRSGWSVIASGLLGRESDPDAVEKARAKIDAWARGERDTVLRLAIDDLGGRRVGHL
jgi:nitroimidazol reductase NimA-like FMN-containing flavoprotein (pyridoxamine 5'-phosphate oxidase superfamily)